MTTSPTLLDAVPVAELLERLERTVEADGWVGERLRDEARRRMGPPPWDVAAATTSTSAAEAA